MIFSNIKNRLINIWKTYDDFEEWYNKYYSSDIIINPNYVLARKLPKVVNKINNNLILPQAYIEEEEAKNKNKNILMVSMSDITPVIIGCPNYGHIELSDEEYLIYTDSVLFKLPTKTIKKLFNE